MKPLLAFFFSSTVLILLSACGSKGPLVFDLMPAPAAFTETGIKMPNQDDLIKDTLVDHIFYATDRQPATPLDKQQFYSSKRGNALRLGRAQIETGHDDLTWQDARKISLLKTRTEKFPIKVKSANEYGLLDDSIHPYSSVTQQEVNQSKAATQRYIREINQQLAQSKNDTINIFVHGYKVTFENPILTTAEMWHFLAYDGVFIAYSWPSTPKTLAYVSDTETALVSSRHLRDLILFLADRTKVKKINVIGYSAGSRVVTRAMGDLAILQYGKSPAENKKRLKLGTVAIIAGDVDRKLVGGYLLDGADKLMDQFLIYQSDADKALFFSRFLTSRHRLGETFDLENVDQKALQYLNDNPHVVIIDVSDAEAARAGNGHGYLRNSPWVTSDLLMSLAYAPKPEARGLVRKKAHIPYYTFPKDYTKRLGQALRRYNPELFD
ncbi:alpha/beta hydrolase [Rubritalea tangerina]|uniref:Alpha/beta hydrolase n=2 Tax=Rubritalea tangerina TaxID=430798 RepID=A0ABW4ZCY4_9BACT